MNGDVLLQKFLEFIQKEKPSRFGFGSYADLHGEPCSIVYAKEAGYGAFDAVIFQRFGDWTKDIIPIEAKGDSDILDDRLRTQIWCAIKNFGKSLLLIDKEQAYKIKKLGLEKLLPTEIWAFNGETFIQLSEPLFKYHASGKPAISQRAIEKAFGVHEPKTIRRLQKKIVHLQSIISRITANQWRYGHEEKFSEEEAEFIYSMLLDFKPKPEKDVRNVASTGFSEKFLQKTLIGVKGANHAAES